MGCNKMKKNSKKILISLLIILILLALLFIFFYFNNASRYKVKGVDVSHHQGLINWSTLKNQDISFAFIKATEGSTYVDEYFERNFTEAKNNHIIVGAYHFFSFESDSVTQAENFYRTVKSQEGMLPPVVDIELYGKFRNNPPAKDMVISNLQIFLDELEEKYSVQPMIYATMKSYNLYIKDNFDDYNLWIRNIYYSPNIDLNSLWTFWQYTDHAILKGYEGNEKYIDLNVYHGTLDELKTLCIQ